MFEPGEREKIVSTGILNDDTPEIEEIFYFVLYDSTGDSVVHTPYNVSVYIAPNDDPNGIISFHPDYLVVMGEEGENIDLVIRRTRGAFGRLLITLNLMLITTGHPDLPVSMGDLVFSTDVIMQDGSANTTVTIQVSNCIYLVVSNNTVSLYVYCIITNKLSGLFVSSNLIFFCVF